MGTASGKRPSRSKNYAHKVLKSGSEPYVQSQIFKPLPKVAT